MPRIRQVREPDGSLSPYREREDRGVDPPGAERTPDPTTARSLTSSRASSRCFSSARIRKRTSLPGSPTSRTSSSVSCARPDTTPRRGDSGRSAAARSAPRPDRRARTPRRRTSGDLAAGDGAGGRDVALEPVAPRAVARRDAELPGPVAEEVASAVERKVFALGLKSVSADLVRHLVECELFERGIETGERAGERIPISIGSLTERRSSRRRRPERSPGESIAAAVLEHFALTEVHGAAVAAAHAEGVLHVHGLDNPLAVERLALPWDLAAARPGAAARPRAASTCAGRSTRSGRTSRARSSFPTPWPRLLAAGRPDAAIDDLVDAVTFRDAYGRAKRARRRDRRASRPGPGRRDRGGSPRACSRARPGRAGPLRHPATARLLRRRKPWRPRSSSCGRARWRARSRPRSRDSGRPPPASCASRSRASRSTSRSS